MKHSARVLVWCALLSGCTRQPVLLPPDFRPDIGAQAYEPSRPITGSFDALPLGKTRFRALVSAMHYPDKKDAAPDFCFISVEQWDGTQGTVCFQRQFPVASIPASVLTAKAKDIVSFDSARWLVTFTIGATNYTYPLPHTP